MTDRHAKYRFSWREGNRFRLHIDGNRFFPAMLEAIASARHSVLFEMYLFTSGTIATRFLDAFAAAVGRGVTVRVLLDDYGARGLDRRDRQRLAWTGVQIAYYNPLRYGKWRHNLFRDHRKVLIVDGCRAFTGGLGIFDEFDPATASGPPWRETVIEVHGPVVSDWETLFIENWDKWMPGPAPPATHSAVAVGDQLGRVTFTRGPTYLEIKRSFFRRINNAERRIWMATAYFVPSWKQLRALARAAKRGTDVRLLLPGPRIDHPGVRHAGRHFYGRLLRHGVHIFEYQPRFLHAKVLLCDHWVTIGSSNMDRWNLRWNLDANQEIEDPAFSGQVQAMFEADFAASHEIQFREWRHRPWYQRLQERVWGYISKRLSRLGPGFRNRD